MIDIHYEIGNLVEYAVRKKLIEEEDRVYATNAVLEVLEEDAYVETFKEPSEEPVEEILGRIRRWAVENNKVENDANELLDLLDTRIMGVFIARPSLFRKEFWRHYQESPAKATEFYYEFSKNANYIRQQRVAKDVKWTHDTPYGALDMTINLSKPEKDPRAIALASRGVLEGQGKYPKCLLCKENEGYAGRIDHPARQNLRIIPLSLNEEAWYMQYSPYVYFNEHCIVFKGSHDPMKITKDTIQRLLDFVALFPHYMLGSNADLPIVGGSILTHDHFQGGNYTFAMAKAKEYDEINIEEAGVEMVKLHWPMSVLRLKSHSIDRLVEASDRVIGQWKHYTDMKVNVRSHTGEEEHNTITPIVRFRNGQYEVDLILRNNRKDEQHPYGIFHSHEKYHHIKRENIGLIECLGLAVLPSRLRNEMNALKDKLIEGDMEGIYADGALNKHGDFARRILEENASIDQANALDILYDGIGRVFLNVLENCGVFKKDEEGEMAFQRCFEVMYESIKA